MVESPSWDWTPREMALWREIQELKQDLRHARDLASVPPERSLYEEREMVLPEPVKTLQIPAVGGVEAKRVDTGMLAVKVWAGALARTDSEISYRYHIGGEIQQARFVNSVLPEMHLNMLRELAKLFR